MSTIVYEELKAVELEQEILIEKRIILKGIRLHLIKIGTPTGSIRLTMYDSDLTYTTKTIPLTDFAANGITATYFHGMVYFQFDNEIILTKAKKIKFKLEGISGYTYANTNHIGWIKEFENRIAPTISEVTDFSLAPFGIELYILEGL